MQVINKSMAGIVKNLDSALKANNLEKVAQTMDQVRQAGRLSPVLFSSRLLRGGDLTLAAGRRSRKRTGEGSSGRPMKACTGKQAAQLGREQASPGFGGLQRWVRWAADPHGSERL